MTSNLTRMQQRRGTEAQWNDANPVFGFWRSWSKPYYRIC